MISQYRLAQDEVASIIQAAFSYNEIEVQDIAFDISDPEAGLSVLVSGTATPLQVRDKPDPKSEGIDIGSLNMIQEWRKKNAGS